MTDNESPLFEYYFDGEGCGFFGVGGTLEEAWEDVLDGLHEPGWDDHVWEGDLPYMPPYDGIRVRLQGVAEWIPFLESEEGKIISIS